jgi:predicted HTH domain antitoxin
MIPFNCSARATMLTVSVQMEFGREYQQQKTLVRETLQASSMDRQNRGSATVVDVMQEGRVSLLTVHT